MTSRERVQRALRFEETDRVPVDLGGCIASGIQASALAELRRHLGLEDRPVRVCDIFQMLGEVEMDVVDALGIDCLHISWPVDRFGIRVADYKPWRLFDGSQVLVPGQFNVDVAPDGSWLLHREGDSSKPVEGCMPKDGYYFDMPSELSYSCDFTPPSIAEIKRKTPPIEDEELCILADQAREKRHGTDKAIMLECNNVVGLGRVGSFWEFQCLTMADPGYVKELFDFRTERALESLKLLKQAVGDHIDVITILVMDLGYQNGEAIPPEVFREVHVPFLKKQNDWVHENTPWKTFMHSCGSIPNILPLLVDIHLDIINPVQTSAKGMDPGSLKSRFGGKIVFWGGGVDTQNTLPFGTVEAVENEVTHRVSVLGSGGGFVFNPIHNIQAKVPPENVRAAYRAAIGAKPVWTCL